MEWEAQTILYIFTFKKHFRKYADRRKSFSLDKDNRKFQPQTKLKIQGSYLKDKCLILHDLINFVHTRFSDEGWLIVGEAEERVQQVLHQIDHFLYQFASNIRISALKNQNLFIFQKINNFEIIFESKVEDLSSQTQKKVSIIRLLKLLQ